MNILGLSIKYQIGSQSNNCYHYDKSQKKFKLYTMLFEFYMRIKYIFHLLTQTKNLNLLKYLNEISDVGLLNQLMK